MLPLGLVLWYQDDRLVERQSSRVKVVTQVTNVTISTLTVTAATLQDSGNYSCWPSAGRPDSVLVHVIQGELLPCAILFLFVHCTVGHVLLVYGYVESNTGSCS